MFCDRVADLDAAERARYADLLVLIAAADGELVREEIQLLESFMGIAMVHPEARTSIRQGLFDTNRLSNLLKNADVAMKNISQEVDEFYSKYFISSDLIELRNISLVATLTIKSALKRKESRGLHYSLDYPNLLKTAKPTILDPKKINL